MVLLGPKVRCRPFFALKVTFYRAIAVLEAQSALLLLLFDGHIPLGGSGLTVRFFAVPAASHPDLQPVWIVRSNRLGQHTPSACIQGTV